MLPLINFTCKILFLGFRYTKKIANPFHVPLFIEDDILRHIPPCIIFACEHDVLKNDAQMFHERLRRLNKKTEIYVWEGALHAHLVLSESFNETFDLHDIINIELILNIKRNNNSGIVSLLVQRLMQLNTLMQ